ncbi:MAG: hypothetical protein ACI86X_000931 [Moritella sp.]|jgi:hypothetical protein
MNKSKIAAIVGSIVIIFYFISVYWSVEPDTFSPKQVTEELTNKSTDIAVGSYTTASLIKSIQTLDDKNGGYLSNSILPPANLMDNMPAWELGVLEQARDLLLVLRRDFSRSQTQSAENKDLQKAHGALNVEHTRLFPTNANSEYKKTIEELSKYLIKLGDNNSQNAQFYARADNLAEWFKQVEKRLGSLSQRLSASVGQYRINTDLSGDTAAQQSTSTPDFKEVKTPWLQIDDVFWEARGSSWALYHYLKAARIDFNSVLAKKNATASVDQIILELEASLQPVLSPMVLNGGGFGISANHSLVMANYLSRANAAVIDLRRLLQQG